MIASALRCNYFLRLRLLSLPVFGATRRPCFLLASPEAAANLWWYASRQLPKTMRPKHHRAANTRVLVVVVPEICTQLACQKAFTADCASAPLALLSSQSLTMRRADWASELEWHHITPQGNRLRRR